MLGHFPAPYPDELLYSIVARYHIRSGNKSFLQTHQELFETTELQPDKIVLPNNLNFLASQLPKGSVLTVESLIKRNTLYPFFRTFLTPLEIYSFKNLVREKSSTSISQAAKISDKERNTVLKFCPKCQQEDIQKYGEAYWHRQHQIPGMLVCLKHQIPLAHSQVFLDNKLIHYYAASQMELEIDTNQDTCSEDLINKSLSLAQEIYWLSQNYLEFRGMTWLRNKYKSLLIDRGFITKYSRTRFKYHEQQLADAFLEFYGEKFLQAIQPIILEKPETYLEYYLLSCDITQTIDRITHVLIIKFLCDSLRDIFD
jgi:hypothetical protein